MKAYLIQYDSVTLLAYLLLALGLFIRYHIGKRRFNRRNIAGMQVFPSYRSAVWVTLAERLILFVANLLILGGVCLRLITAFNISLHH